MNSLAFLAIFTATFALPSPNNNDVLNPGLEYSTDNPNINGTLENEKVEENDTSSSTVVSVLATFATDSEMENKLAKSEVKRKFNPGHAETDTVMWICMGILAGFALIAVPVHKFMTTGKCWNCNSEDEKNDKIEMPEKRDEAPVDENENQGEIQEEIKDEIKAEDVENKADEDNYDKSHSSC